jgi:hypothetical protein
MKKFRHDFCIVVSVDDYHEFGYIQDILNMVHCNVKYKECGILNGEYKAVFYTNKLYPEVKALIQEVTLSCEVPELYK